MASELAIPQNLEAACRQLLESGPIRQVDLGRVNGRPFILRVGIGLEAEIVTRAEPKQKSRFGALAYGLAGLAALKDPPISDYWLDIDGERVQQQAVTCLVINSGNLGRPELQLAEEMRIDDGILDVALLRQVDLDSITEVLAGMIGSRTNGHSLKHWRGRQIRVEADPAQPAEADGEAIGGTPLEFEIMPGKVMMLEGGRQTNH
jgi:diacylglycerol kinase family enzyme